MKKEGPEVLKPAAGVLVLFYGTNVPIPIETKGIGTITIEIGKRENRSLNSNSRIF